MDFIKHNIRSWALVSVAVTTLALIGFGAWLISILASPDWCNRALGDAKYTEGPPEYAIGGCFSLMTRQVQALAINSHIVLGTLALCLAVLVVIVLAGGKLSFTANRDGMSADIAKDEAAQTVADAAQDTADAIKDIPA